jgi:hypothetical protein
MQHRGLLFLFITIGTGCAMAGILFLNATITIPAILLVAAGWLTIIITILLWPQERSWPLKLSEAGFMTCIILTATIMPHSTIFGIISAVLTVVMFVIKTSIGASE